MSIARPHPCLRVAILLLVGGCANSDSTAPVVVSVTPEAPVPGTLAVGASLPVMRGTAVKIAGGNGGEYVLVVVDTATGASTGGVTYSVAGSGIAAAGSISPPAMSRMPSAMTVRELPQMDVAFGARLNARAASKLRPLFASARAARRASPGGPSRSMGLAEPRVGDMVTYNVGQNACDSVVSRAARVVAVGQRALVVTDTLNPASGFTAEDFGRFAANFDTLVYPVNVANFGEPSDIDGNGRVTLLFTSAVNELTPRNSESYVGGFFFSRDLFPQNGTASLQACRGSNVGELMYLIAPDPTGLINGNRRTTGFVDSLTTALLAHEFQHLINGSRRVYVNNAEDFEKVWLNEGLSHIAEELLFYRQSALTPRQNIGVETIRASVKAIGAFNTSQASNASRYRLYLTSPSESSPIRDDDELSTRGASWNFLRWAGDRKVRLSGSAEAAVWQALVNSRTSGIANLRAVFGADVGGMLRDWSTAQYVDDLVPAASVDFMQPSWNWRSIFGALSTTGYPLAVSSLSAAGVSGSVVPGGAAFHRFAIARDGLASVTLTAATGAVSGVLVRIR